MSCEQIQVRRPQHCVSSPSKCIVLTVSLSKDSLNALYVYEAKLSFLTRTAATTEGAEKLLDAQALPKLASGSFLEERPRPNDAAMGKRHRIPDRFPWS